MSFSVGSLVRARDREWVVLPGSADDLVLVRPLGGTEAEVTGILSALEAVEPATFAPPDPRFPGDDRSARLLRDALRLGFRSSAGPFRCAGRIAVEPRPYQLVPLLMALKLDPVRLLIADDVGIGKTVEAALVAAELLEQGDARRLAVLCPPHLAEQWQRELAEKFHLDAELVLASTAARLERHLGPGRTIFDAHPYVIVSTDFIKSDRRRHDFLRTCPELVIVDEAHTCADDGTGAGGRGHHQRHELVAGLAADPARHLILVTATPHSGKEGAFRSLLTLIDPSFATLPDSLGGDVNRRHRERLAAHLVQRRRADIRAYLDTETPFPRRLEREETYRLTPEYRALFERALTWARETVRDPEGGQHRQRVRWWSALAMLRSLASSPAAAAATLETRAAPADTATAAEADEVGRRSVLDQADDEESESPDVVPGSEIASSQSGDQHDDVRARRQLREMARMARALHGDADAKLVQAARLVATLVAEGNRPIVFCRFIDTAEYLADELRARLPRDTEVTSVTGTLAPVEREARIAELATHARRVLVATDCLSEGINLQDAFDAVVHYDLPWNPTRLEQREGRVDRFGQRRPEVRVVTYYGADNQIDEIVLEVLLRKHRTIRSSLGISIPVPGDTGTVINAVAENLLLRQDHGGISDRLPGMEEFLRPATEQLLIDWDDAAERETRSRTVFAQASIKVDEVARELTAVRGAIGSGTDVEWFVRSAVTAAGGQISEAIPSAAGQWDNPPAVTIDLAEASQALRDAVGGPTRLAARFHLPVADGERHLTRTDPFVAALASHVLDSALDPLASSVARRCGLIRTAAVSVRATLVLVRYRFHLLVSRHGEEHPLLAEDCATLGFTGPPSSPAWLSPGEVEPLLHARPAANVDPAQASDFLAEAVKAADAWRAHLDDDARARAEALSAAHHRVRAAAAARGVRTRVEPQLPPDVLGIYVYLPVPRSQAEGRRPHDPSQDHRGARSSP